MARDPHSDTIPNVIVAFTYDSMQQFVSNRATFQMLYSWLRDNCTSRWKYHTDYKKRDGDFSATTTYMFESEEDAMMFKVKFG
jgi:hypothetical protein